MHTNNQQKLIKLSGDEFIKIGEISRPFWERGTSGNPPKFVVLMGGIASGKTTTRREKYAVGYVNFDFGEIHLAFEKAIGRNNPKLAEYTTFASDMILRESIDSKKNIVIEIIGDNYNLIIPVIDKMKEIGYKPEIVGLISDIVESKKRYDKALEEDKDYISAFRTQVPTLSFFFSQLELGDMPEIS